jgi:hypothetical protein
MAQTIKIKRSSSAASPSALENGELAYSSNSNYLYIGRPGGGTGDIDVIGGKTYVDMLEGTSAVPNNLIIENSATVGGHLELREATNNGTNYVRLKSPNSLTSNLTFTLPTAVTDGYFLTTDASGNLSFAPSTDINVNVANLTARLPQITESVTIGDATDVTITTSGSLVVTGDLTVSGTTTTVNSETLTVDDNIIVLNNNVTGAPTEDAGIEVERGTSANVLLRYNETNDRWEFTNNGTNYFNIPTSTEYDAYTSWTVGDGTNTEAVTSGFSLTFDGSSFSYTAGTNTIAITTLDGGTYS